MYHTFRDVIDNWPGGIKGLAEDAGVDRKLVSGWKRRNLIPSNYWLRMVDRAAGKGFTGITLRTLAKISHDKAIPPPTV